LEIIFSNAASKYSHTERVHGAGFMVQGVGYR